MNASEYFHEPQEVTQDYSRIPLHNPLDVPSMSGHDDGEEMSCTQSQDLTMLHKRTRVYAALNDPVEALPVPTEDGALKPGSAYSQSESSSKFVFVEPAVLEIKKRPREADAGDVPKEVKQARLDNGANADSTIALPNDLASQHEFGKDLRQAADGTTQDVVEILSGFPARSPSRSGDHDDEMDVEKSSLYDFSVIADKPPNVIELDEPNDSNYPINANIDELDNNDVVPIWITRPKRQSSRVSAPNELPRAEKKASKSKKALLKTVSQPVEIASNDEIDDPRPVKKKLAKPRKTIAKSKSCPKIAKKPTARDLKQSPDSKVSMEEEIVLSDTYSSEDSEGDYSSQSSSHSESESDIEETQESYVVPTQSEKSKLKKLPTLHGSIDEESIIQTVLNQKKFSIPDEYVIVTKEKPARNSQLKCNSSSPVLKGMNFLLTGLETEDADVHLSEGVAALIKRMGGTVVDTPTAMKLKDTLHSDNYSCVLISTGPKRTMKYITALACRMACVSFRFILDCCRFNRLCNLSNYLLPYGPLENGNLSVHAKHFDYPAPIEALLFWNKKKDEPYRIDLVGDPNFKRLWKPVLYHAGARVVERLYSGYEKLDYIFSDPTPTVIVRDKARELKKPICTTEWLIQSLINQKLLPPESNEKFTIT